MQRTALTSLQPLLPTSNQTPTKPNFNFPNRIINRRTHLQKKKEPPIRLRLREGIEEKSDHVLAANAAPTAFCLTLATPAMNVK